MYVRCPDNEDTLPTFGATLFSAEAFTKRPPLNPGGWAHSPHTTFDRPNDFGDPAHFHVTLSPHAFLEERYIDLHFARKTAVVALGIQTTVENMLESFTLRYSRLDHVDGGMSEMRAVDVFRGVPLVSCRRGVFGVLVWSLENLSS